MDEDMDWDANPETKEPKERQRKPRNHAGPIPKAIYNLFFTAVRAKKLNKIQYPSGPELKAVGFPKPLGGHTRRERFKHWAERMDVGINPETNTESLIHKRTGKVIVPLEEFENVIRGVHENNGEKHIDLKTTLNIIQDKYTMGGRAFGMNRGVVRYVVDTCQECIIDFALGKNEKVKNGITPSIPICNGLLAPESCSMVTHVPNTACVWFDKTVMLSSNEPYTKLLLLINEMKGELPAIAKGNKEAKERFVYKVYTTTECIRSLKSTAGARYETTEPYTHQMHEDITELLSFYKREMIEHQFLQDMELLFDTYRTSGYSDYFLRSLQASISVISQRKPEISKQQVIPTNGFSIDLRQGMSFVVPQCS